jgi:hypothetical protein
MTSALIKKTNKKSFSSLSTKYVENFVSRVEDKLFDFNKTFFSPYKKKLDELDKSVITDIEKNLSSPALLVKNQLDELWNYHWMLGQTDVLSNRNKKSNLTSYSSNHTNLITFATQEDLAVKGMWDAKVEKAILKDYDRRVTRLQRDLTKATNVDKKGISAQLQDISRELEQFLGKIQNRQATATTKQFATIGVRVRDLQETVRVMELKLSEGTSSISSPTDIDILNSSQFGTIYQDKRTLLLGQSYAGDYKKGIISSIKKYFANNEGIRPKTRERDLFTQLTKNTSTNISKEEVSRVKTLTSSRDRLSNKDRLAAQAVQQFISSVSKGRSLTDKKIQQFIKGDSSDSSISKLISATQNTIYEDNASRLVDEIRNIGTNEGSYSTNIKPLLQEIKNREKYPLGDNVERVFDTRSNSYRSIEELETSVSNIFGIQRIKRIAETEISLAYNLGRLKKLEELGYKKVRISNEAENHSNRQQALNVYGSLAKAYRSDNNERYLPMLCTYCLNKNNQVMDISTIYKGKVDTKYEVEGKYSSLPPFHVSCWCYFVGVEESKQEDEGSLVTELAEGIKNSVIADSLSNQTTSNAFYNDPFIKKLVIAGAGLLSVGAAYYAYTKLARNRVQIPLNLRPKTSKVAQQVSNVPQEVQEASLKNFVDNLDTTAMVEVAEVASKLPKAFRIVSGADNLISTVDNQLFQEVYSLTNTTQATLNELIADNPDYLSILDSLLSSKKSYEGIRDRILQNQLKGQDLDELYQTYLDSKQEYEAQLSRYLQATKDKRSNLVDLSSNLNVSAREVILDNRSNLPKGASLQSALDNLKSRKLIDSSNRQLKSIEKNLNKEISNISDLQSRESRLIDTRLGGRDSRARAEQLKNIKPKIPSTTLSSKNLDAVVANVNKIKRDLNDNRLNLETIRSISKKRLDSSSVADRALLIDTQKQYYRQILTEKERVVSQLKSMTNVDSLENFSKLYRSEINNKAKTGYQYSNGLWKEADITKLDSTYKEVSNILTVKKSYESYLSELDDMLEKMNNFESVISSNIQFSSIGDSDDINLRIEKLRRIPKVGCLKMYGR